MPTIVNIDDPNDPDIVAFIGLDFTRLIRLALPENLTEVARWAEAMRERPAAKA
jgi:glutathione S-transferase